MCYKGALVVDGVTMNRS